MSKRWGGVLTMVMAGMLATAVAVSAHHSFAMFDMEKDVEDQAWSPSGGGRTRTCTSWST